MKTSRKRWDDERNSWECVGCDLPLPLNDLGLCAECATKLERDLIRARDWNYSTTAFFSQQNSKSPCERESFGSTVPRTNYWLRTSPNPSLNTHIPVSRSVTVRLPRKRYANTAPRTYCKRHRISFRRRLNLGSISAEFRSTFMNGSTISSRIG